jgi:hypothetical protein
VPSIKNQLVLSEIFSQSDPITLIQKGVKPMPYTLVPAVIIAERSYEVAPTIQFTKFTSCIGVLAKVQGQPQVIGIHLALYDDDPEGHLISVEDVPQVNTVLTNMHYDPTTVRIIGMTDVWNSSVPEVYAALVTAYTTPLKPPLTMAHMEPLSTSMEVSNVIGLD